jgi:cytochrome P450/NADPH-cytochrome P450 reductase
VEKPIKVHALLSGYVELSQPASGSDLRILLKHAPEGTKPALETLLASHAELVMSVRLSVLDILERYPDIAISFPAFHHARRATLTVSVLHAPALADHEQAFLGVGSSYLAGLRAGDRVALSVRPFNAAFHLPADPTVPVVMFAAGSGLAPMRGFIQERAEQRKAGRETGRMILYYGCRTPEDDYLYSDSDLEEWTALGVVDVRPAFSKLPDASYGCKYVQE